MKEIKADSEKWKGRENQIRGEDSAFKRIDNLKKGENDENSKTLILLLKSGAIFQLRFQQSLGTNRKNWLWQKEISLSAPLWVEQPAVDRAGSASNSRRPSSQDPSSCFSFHLSSPLLSSPLLLLQASSLPSVHPWLPAWHPVWTFFLFSADPNLLTSHHHLSGKVPLGVTHGWVCCHTGWRLSFKAQRRWTVSVQLTVEGCGLGQRSWRCSCDS